MSDKSVHIISLPYEQNVHIALMMRMECIRAVVRSANKIDAQSLQRVSGYPGFLLQNPQALFLIILTGGFMAGAEKTNMSQLAKQRLKDFFQMQEYTMEEHVNEEDHASVDLHLFFHMSN